MNYKILLVAGVIIVIISLLADTFGVGREPGFGYLQIAGTIVGVALVIWGIIKLRKK